MTPEPNAAAIGSICDAILTPAQGALTLPILSRLAGPGPLASNDAAMRAVSLAAALFRDTSPTVIRTASGGNVDPALFRSVPDRFA